MKITPHVKCLANIFAKFSPSEKNHVYSSYNRNAVSLKQVEVFDVDKGTEGRNETRVENNQIEDTYRYQRMSEIGGKEFLINVNWAIPSLCVGVFNFFFRTAWWILMKLGNTRTMVFRR